MYIKRQKQLRKEINLIPLINVIFLLLIFFMVAGQVQRIDVLEVKPPLSSIGEEQRYLPVVLHLDVMGGVALNGNLVHKEDLELLLEVSLNEHHTIPSVTLRADRNAKANELVWLMDKVRMAGADEISIVTEGASQ